MSAKVWYDDLVLSELEGIRTRERAQHAMFDKLCASLSDGKSLGDGVILDVRPGPACHVTYKGEPVFAFEVGGRAILLSPVGADKLSLSDIEAAKQVMARLMAGAIGRVEPTEYIAP
jgi:hypothetical protein